MMPITSKRIFIDVVERHADEAAFFWEQRERAARSPIFDLPALQSIDDRLDANLEGLLVAGQDGLRVALGAFDRATRSTEGPDGELFAASYVAVELADNLALARLLAFAQRAQRHERAFVAALAWLPTASAERVLNDLLAVDCPPALHRFGIAARGARREDPGPALARALVADDAPLRASACRAAGRFGRKDLLPQLRDMTTSPHEPIRIWAAWAAVLLGDSASRKVLWDTVAESDDSSREGASWNERASPPDDAGAALQDDAAARAACDLAARASDPAEAAQMLVTLSASERLLPAALAGAAARGDPACLSWVLDVVERKPTFARRAAWVYATITGARPEPPLFVRVPSEVPSNSGLAEHLGDPHRDLPAPVAEALREHWSAARLLLRDGKRYLGGKPLDSAWLRQCLREGPQPWRASAAIELQRALGGKVLFPILAPARAQLALL